MGCYGGTLTKWNDTELEKIFAKQTSDNSLAYRIGYVKNTYDQQFKKTNDPIFKTGKRTVQLFIQIYRYINGNKH